MNRGSVARAEAGSRPSDLPPPDAGDLQPAAADLKSDAGDLQPGAADLRHDVLRGLSTAPRSLPPKYFYDAAGAALFERICELDAYYPTRTELSILQDNVGAMSAAIGPRATIVEFGSGSGVKTRLLLRAIEAPVAYIPVDISCAQLRRFATRVATEFPSLEVLPVCADYTRAFALPQPARAAARTVAFFPGSTIGNFEEAEAAAFLRRAADLCGTGGGLLLGVDLHKDTAVLNRAYNDDEGVTAAFNLNLLTRINRDCGTDFDTAAFRHVAFYDDARQRIEMRLVCVRACTVTLPARGWSRAPSRFRFRPGEYIITEYSHKYTLERLAALAARTGWTIAEAWTDPRRWFAVALLLVSAR